MIKVKYNIVDYVVWETRIIFQKLQRMVFNTQK